MLKISNVKVKFNHTLQDVVEKACKVINVDNVDKFLVDKKSLDARKKNNIHYVYSILVHVANEEMYTNIPNVSKAKIASLSVEECRLDKNPIVVGSGPGGLFAALILTLSNTNPIIIERGRDVRNRKLDIEKFWNEGILNTESNVQFGEGGAGTFSDGKLTTGIKDLRCKIVLQKLVEFGAPEEIMYESKPHVGTDILIKIVENMRNYLIDNGATFLFEHKLTDIVVTNNQVKKIHVETPCEKKVFDVNHLILAIGHSARDTFELIHKNGLEITAKPFAMGVRIEHLQTQINKVQYGDLKINAADYKIAGNLSNGRAGYTFCMCPGGLVVASSSEKNTVVTNGMSYHARSQENANSALLINVLPEDIDSDHPLKGMYLQRDLEQKAFVMGGSDYSAPVQKVRDFLNRVASKSVETVKPSYKPGYKLVNIHEMLPDFMSESLILAIKELDRKLRGFNTEDAILTAIESRTSSPIRINRDSNYMSNIKGIIPCGEGAGYAGGIMSAAVDGIKCAESIILQNVIKVK